MLVSVAGFSPDKHLRSTVEENESPFCGGRLPRSFKLWFMQKQDLNNSLNENPNKLWLGGFLLCCLTMGSSASKGLHAALSLKDRLRTGSEIFAAQEISLCWSARALEEKRNQQAPLDRRKDGLNEVWQKHEVCNRWPTAVEAFVTTHWWLNGAGFGGQSCFSSTSTCVGMKGTVWMGGEKKSTHL